MAASASGFSTANPLSGARAQSSPSTKGNNSASTGCSARAGRRFLLFPLYQIEVSLLVEDISACLLLGDLGRRQTGLRDPMCCDGSGNLLSKDATWAQRGYVTHYL